MLSWSIHDSFQPSFPATKPSPGDTVVPNKVGFLVFFSKFESSRSFSLRSWWLNIWTRRQTLSLLLGLPQRDFDAQFSPRIRTGPGKSIPPLLNLLPHSIMLVGILKDGLLEAFASAGPLLSKSTLRVFRSARTI